jgi:hypothetical protein
LAAIPEVRARLWRALPKWLLLGLSVAFLSTILALIPYVLHLRRKHQILSTALEYWEPTADARELAYSKAQAENGILRADPNEAHNNAQELAKRIEELTHVGLDETEVVLLKWLPDPRIAPYALTLAIGLGQTQVRTDYHLQRLVEWNYVSRTQSPQITKPDYYQLTQKARDYLITRNLI